MKKILFILIVVSMSCVYGQARQSIPDTLRAHRTAIDLKAPIASPTFTGTVTVPLIDVTTSMSLGDSKFIYFGTGQDMAIYHDGSNAYLDNGTGFFSMSTTAGSDLKFGVGSTRWTINGSSYAILPSITSSYNLGSSSYTIADLFADTVKTSGIILGGTAIVPTAAELNYVDGATSNLQTQISAITSAQGATIVDSIQAQYQYRNFVISYPYTNMENIPLKIGQVTLVGLEAVLQDGTSVVFMIQKGSNITSGTDVLSSDLTCTSTTTAQDFTSDISGTYDDIASTEYVWLDIGAVTGTVKTITVTMKLIGRD